MKNEHKEKLTDQIEKIINNLILKKAIPKPSPQERKLLVNDIMQDLEKNLKNPEIALSNEKEFSRFLVFVIQLHLMIEKHSNELAKLGYKNDSVIRLVMTPEKELSKVQKDNLLVLKKLYLTLADKLQDKEFEKDLQELFKKNEKYEQLNAKENKKSTGQSEDPTLGLTDADKSNIERFGAKPETGQQQTCITKVIENAFGIAVTRTHDIDTPIEQTLKQDEVRRKSPFDLPTLKPPGTTT